MFHRVIRLFRQEFRRAAYSKKLFKELQFSHLSFWKALDDNAHRTLNFYKLFIFKDLKECLFQNFHMGWGKKYRLVS